MAFESPEAKAEREIKELEERMNAEAKPPESTGDQGGAATATEEGEDSELKKTEEEKKKAEESVQTDDPNSDTWKQRYLSLQGVHRSERERWTTDRADLIRQIDELKTKIGTLSSKEQEKVEVDDEYRSASVTDETRNSLPYRRMLAEYGQKHAELHFESLAPQQTQNKDEDENSKKVEIQKFFAGLKHLAPNWNKLNDDPKFIEWLSKPIPYSGGLTLQDKLNEAVNTFDAAMAAQFFLDFIDEQRSGNAQKEPDELLNPAKRGSASQGAADNNQGKVYTRSEWDEGWKSLELNKLSPKDATALEIELTKAMQEGRVVG